MSLRPSLLLAPLAVATLLACSSSNTATPPPLAPLPAESADSVAATGKAELVAGVILSREGKLVTAEVDGRVEKLVVSHGQRVTKGMPLAVVDDSEMKRQLEVARGAEDTATGELRRAETTRAEASRQLRQARALFSDGAVSRDSVSAAASAYAIADAQVQTAHGAIRRARASVEQAEQLLAKTTIVAPMDGVITLVKVTPGQMVGRGQPIARIFDPADLWVRFAIPPTLRERVRDGAKVIATPVGTGTTQPYEATIRVIGRTLEPPLQLAVIEADLDDARLADHDALLGTMVDVRIE